MKCNWYRAVHLWTIRCRLPYVRAEYRPQATWSVDLRRLSPGISRVSSTLVSLNCHNDCSSAYLLFHCAELVPYSTQNPKDEITYCCDDRRFARNSVTACSPGRRDRPADRAFSFAETAWLLAKSLFYRWPLHSHACHAGKSSRSASRAAASWFRRH